MITSTLHNFNYDKVFSKNYQDRFKILYSYYINIKANSNKYQYSEPDSY